MGLTADNAVHKTREYLDSILVEERLIDSVIPTLEIELYGQSFATPIMTPAFSHLKKFVKECENGMYEYSKAAALVNTLNWVGMCENDEFADIMKAGAQTVRIVKPYADRDKIFSQLGFAAEQGAIAVGMDIDHIFGNDGTCDCVFGEKMACQTLNEMKEYVEYTELPFIVKGVLSVRDARKCGEMGAKGIVVSHHHGRMPYAIPPLMILPDIVKAAKEYPGMKVFVDCGMDSGYDAFKAIALGADAVSAGRVLMAELAKGGASGVQNYLQTMNEQLAFSMGFCGCKTVTDIDASVLYNAQGQRLDKERRSK